MFTFEKTKISSEVPIITHDFKVLLYDDEPILYSGKNRYGTYIIGSSIDEDYEKKLEWDFHVLVDTDTYMRFLRREISYLEILEKTRDIYIVEKSFDNTLTNSYLVDFREIDEDYLPTEGSFCPDPYLSVDIHAPYSVQLESLDEDTGLIGTRPLRNVLENFPKIVDTPISILGKAFDGLTVKPYVEAFQGGSFIVNFDFRLHKKGDQMKLYELVPNFEEEIRILLNKYIEYCFTHLPDELASVLLQKTAPEFNRILGDFESFTSKSSISSEDFHKRFIDETAKVPEIISDLTDDIGVSFNFMELRGIYPIAKIDRMNKKNYETMIEVIERQFFDVDPAPADYKIHVYSLNVDTRRGKANVRQDQDPDKMIRTRIKIQGTEPLEHSKYTGSLHENKYIAVKGTGKRENDILKSIDIIFER